LAAGGASGSEPQTVLVSLSEQISNFAGWWLALLDGDWPTEALPDFFRPPQDPEARTLWERTLATCADLFGSNSREYRLMMKGIVVHHGRMPGRLPDAFAPCSVGLVSGSMIFSCSTVEPGHPCVTMSGSASSCPERT